MLGVRQQQAQRKAEQAQVDAHNAEHCGPLWDQATDHTQRLKAAGGVSATERDNLSVKAEVAWREAFVQCRGSSQNLARGNADALARERGTPLSPQALASIRGGHGAALGAAPAVVAAPVPLPAKVVAVQAGADARPAMRRRPSARPTSRRPPRRRLRPPRPCWWPATPPIGAPLPWPAPAAP
jgi:hypothetical protein